MIWLYSVITYYIANQYYKYKYEIFSDFYQKECGIVEVMLLWLRQHKIFNSASQKSIRHPLQHWGSSPVG